MFLLALAVSQVAPAKATIGEEVAAAQAVAAFELAWWRKNHPKADLALTLNDPAATPALVSLVRKRLGYANPVPVLDPHVLTLILDPPVRSAPKRLTMEGFTFLGSFPKGFRARYLLGMEGKAPKVLSRTVLTSYEIAMPKPTKV